MEGDNYKILKGWHSLLADGTITQEEFNVKKSALLGNDLHTTPLKNIVPLRNEEHSRQPNLAENLTNITANEAKKEDASQIVNEELGFIEKRPKNLLWLWVLLPIVCIFTLIIYLETCNSDNPTNSQSEITSLNEFKKEESRTTPVKAVSFAGYYRGGMQSGYVGGTDNAECRIHDDGTAVFHYALNAGYGNKEATERGRIIEIDGDYYFKTNDGSGTYDVHIKPGKIYIGNGSSWEAEMYMDGKASSSKKSQTEPTTKIENVQDQPLQSSQGRADNQTGYYLSNANTNRKIYFHNSPDETTKRKAYLNTEVTVYVEKVENSFGYINFLNSEGQKSNGWVKMIDLIKIPN